MLDLVFFYGTLLTPFQRTARLGIDRDLQFVGHGTIPAKLFDLGLYPAAVPARDGRVRGELHGMGAAARRVLGVLDEVEGFRPDDPVTSLYIRRVTKVSVEGGVTVDAWAYFYNAPLGRAPVIESGDYLAYTGK